MQAALSICQQGLGSPVPCSRSCRRVGSRASFPTRGRGRGRGRAARLACARASAADQPGPLDDVEACAEALELYQQATQLSDLQTRFDLETAWASEPDGTYDPSSLPTESQVVAFFQEQGLSQSEGASLWRELYPKAQQQQQPPPSLELLAAKMVRLRRVLPGVDVPRMVYKDSSVLSKDLGQALRCLIMLVERMPSRDVMSMIPKFPRLLWSEDLPDRFERGINRLMELHPSSDLNIVLDTVAEHPEILWRLDYYPNATILDDLPVELQNWMVVADLSISGTIRYYRNRASGYAAESNANPELDQTWEGGGTWDEDGSDGE